MVALLVNWLGELGAISLFDVDQSWTAKHRASTRPWVSMIVQFSSAVDWSTIHLGGLGKGMASELGWTGLASQSSSKQIPDGIVVLWRQ